MSHPPISNQRAAELVTSGKSYRSCCGTLPEDNHIPECVHFTAVPKPRRCEVCKMLGFHHADCTARGDESTAENPKHYQHPSGVAAIDVERCMTFSAGSAFKYMVRYEAKANPPEDLRKCRWYLADLEAYDDPIWISGSRRAIATPLLRRMLQFETNEFRRRFFESVLDLDIGAMASAVEDARESVG